jgi:hypothetical protein
MVGERVEEDLREATQSALRGMEDPKASAQEFLLSSLGERKEFAAAAKEQAGEVDAVEAALEEVEKSEADELPNKLGRID